MMIIIILMTNKSLEKAFLLIMTVSTNLDTVLPQFHPVIQQMLGIAKSCPIREKTVTSDVFLQTKIEYSGVKMPKNGGSALQARGTGLSSHAAARRSSKDLVMTVFTTQLRANFTFKGLQHAEKKIFFNFVDFCAILTVVSNTLTAHE